MKIEIKKGIDKEENIDWGYIIKVIPESNIERVELMKMDHYEIYIDKNENLRISMSE